MAKTASAKYVTKLGTFRYPHLNIPDTKYDRDGTYKVDLRQSKELAREFAQLCKRVAEEEWGPAKAKGAKMPYSVDEADNDFVIIKAKAKAIYPPTIANALGKKVDRRNIPAIGTGTTGKLDLRLATTEVKGDRYVSCYLQGVQIAKLVEYGGSSFDAIDEDEVDGADAFIGGDEQAGGFGTLVTDQSANAVSGEYEDDNEELEATDEEGDF